MYMAPVTRTRRTPTSPITRRLVGAPVLLISLAVTAPWLAVNAVVSALILGGAALGRSPRALLQAIDYAGDVALGR